MQTCTRPKTVSPRVVSLISKLLRPLAEEGVLTLDELQTIVANLRHLAAHGTMLPAVMPKLLTQEEAAEMLAISLSNFKKMEHEGRLILRRRMIGSSVRYRNTDVIALILAQDETTAEPDLAGASQG
jgi:hypothetical protein